jgi:hypothetical protein
VALLAAEATSFSASTWAMPQLLQRLVDLTGELAGSTPADALGEVGDEVEQQPAVTPTELDLRGVQQRGRHLGDDLVHRGGPQLAEVGADLLLGRFACSPGAGSDRSGRRSRAAPRVGRTGRGRSLPSATGRSRTLPGRPRPDRPGRRRP